MSVEGWRRPTRALVSTSAITHNTRVLKAVLGESELMAVVKANGYGHGALRAASAALEGGATSLAVAIVDEGVELREAGVSAPILLLAETSPDVVSDAFAHDLTLTIGSLEGARAAATCALASGARQRVHLKVDTGMHRMGVAPEQVEAVLDVLLGCAALDVEGLYTHLSVADSATREDRTFTRAQIELLDGVTAKLAARESCPRQRHLANSAGVLAYPEARADLARVGLALYGYLASDWLASALEERGETLVPAMSLHSRVSALRRVAQGEAPSYGRRRALTRDSWIATVPIGYADGYPRRLFEAGAQVLINAKRYPLAGTVTMDQIVVDLGDDEIDVGAEVLLLGRQGDEVITADELAHAAGTISYEILCGVAARVPRVSVA